MIPWASVTGREASLFTDLQFPLCETILLCHVGEPLDLKEEFETSPMLANASDRRFALSQFDSSHYDAAAEHVEGIESALTQLSTFFDRNGLYMASPNIPTSPYKEELVGLVGKVTDPIEVPDFDTELPITPLPSPALKAVKSPPTNRPLVPRRSSNLDSNRLSITSLIHQNDTVKVAASHVRTSTPLTADSATSTSVLDYSHPDPGKMSLLDLCPLVPDTPSSSIDYDYFYESPDSVILSEMQTLVRARAAYSTAIPFAHPSRTHKQQRMRRHSRSRLQNTPSQSEDIRKAMIMEDESRKRDMLQINETWRAMKQKEDQEEEQRKGRQDARLLLCMKHNVGDEHVDVSAEERQSRREKRRKLDHEYASHVTGQMPRIFERDEREGVDWGKRRYGKHDRGAS